ncbi:glycosyltransferase family 4 protein [Rhizohabitans arisaemae]|uniref:glycosyltransferase family 4 protein n=1 Tax=Rhizohabitans arisaemae TaxID=2720610 RepID=UPI0024B04F2F|nr:glycosyltransferase family 4 protein [Rhizohabitans arisaemae]
MHHAYGVGGTIRATLNLATALAERGHETVITSIFRRRDKPVFKVDPRIRLHPLIDLRKNSETGDAGDPAHAVPSVVFPMTDKPYQQYSRLTDERIAAYLATTDAQVVIGTRPGLNVCLARMGPAGLLRIGQEHLTHDVHSRALRAVLTHSYRALDALVTTTEADAAVYRRRMRLPGVEVLAVPNSVPRPRTALDADREPIVMAAGRLAPGKRYDLLIEAFAKVAGEHPEWRLRIYGGGGEKDRLRSRIDALGLTGRAQLMGVRGSLEAEWAAASIAATTSDAESFGMTIVEAMRCGLPVVSTDCPLGPAEIIHHGVDGLLVPRGDVDAIARALLRLIGDERERRRMGQAALQGSTRFDPEPIAVRYEELFTDLARTKPAREARRPSQLRKARVTAAMWRARHKVGRTVRKWAR